MKLDFQVENKHNVDGLLEEEEKNTEKNYVSLDFGIREKERGRKKTEWNKSELKYL